jgi:DNA mismatch repair protein MutS
VATLHGFGADGLGPAICAAGALLRYAQSTQGRGLQHVRTLTVESENEFIGLDAATRRNLELTETIRAQDARKARRCSPRWTTAAPRWVRACCATGCTTPRDQQVARARHAAIMRWRTAPAGLSPRWRRARHRTHHHPHRPAVGASARPGRPAQRPGSWALRRLWKCAPATPMRHCWASCMPTWPRRGMPGPAGTRHHAEPAAMVRDGGVIARGFDAELDELRGLSENAGQFLLDLEARARTHRHRQPARGIQQGAWLLHRSHPRPDRQGAGRLPPPPDPEERRALHHPELKAFEDKALSAQERALSREKLLYEQLLDDMGAHRRLQAIAHALAQLDTLVALADHAVRNNWCAPQLVDEPCIQIEQGRHPVVENQIERFIANDCQLAAERKLLLITGPTWAVNRPSCARWR